MLLLLAQAKDARGQRWVHLITRAKNNTVAYLQEGEKEPYEECNKIHLRELFDHPPLFSELTLTLYGQRKTVRCLWVDLLWKPVKSLLRFVLVQDGRHCYILMSSDLTLCASTIITIYSYRAKIEVMFRVVKHLLGAFCYHFWSKALPELKRGEKRDYTTLPDRQQQKVRLTYEAIERFVNVAAIALGILQYLSLRVPASIWQGYHGWLRTYSKTPSEQVVRTVIQTEFMASHDKVPWCRTLALIHEKRPKPLVEHAA